MNRLHWKPTCISYMLSDFICSTFWSRNTYTSSERSELSVANRARCELRGQDGLLEKLSSACQKAIMVATFSKRYILLSCVDASIK